MTSIEELAEPVHKARTPSALDVLKAQARDGDGDGIINEGLPSERHVLSQTAVTRMAQAFRLTKPVRVVRGRIGESRLIEGGNTYASYKGCINGVHQIMVHADAPRTGMLAYLAHEMMHAKQYERIGSSFMAVYKKLHTAHGYKKNPLEIEAIKASQAFMRRLEGREDLFKAARDGDGDGFVYDGTPRQHKVWIYHTAPASSAKFIQEHGLRGAADGGEPEVWAFTDLAAAERYADSPQDEPRDIYAAKVDASQLIPAGDGVLDGDQIVIYPEPIPPKDVHDAYEVQKALPKDGDGDGMIYDGTPMERPAPGRLHTDEAPGLPVLPWQDPPPPRGKPGERKAGGFSANGKTATEEGDLGEKIRDHFGLRPAQEGRIGALDAITAHWGYEIKTRTVESTGYRVGMKTKEMNEKRAEARRLNLLPGLILVVIDGQTAYVYHRPGIFNGKLDDSFSFAGVVKL